MPQDRVRRILYTYRERPLKEYVAILKSVSAAGGLNRNEQEALRTITPAVHAEMILRHLELLRNR